MGASGSKTAVAPILPASQFSTAQVADSVRALGPSYVSYAEKLAQEGIDGAVLEAVSVDDLPGLFADIGVTSSLHQKKLEVAFKSFISDSNGRTHDAASASGVKAPDVQPSVFIKAFAGFLSHYKVECGTEARLVQQNLKPIIEKNPIEGSSNEVFLDSDDLSDLRNLLEHVKDTKCLVLLQSKGVLTRPWVIVELHTAITHDVPIVALNVQNANRYDYAAASAFLLHFDQDIDIANPGAAELLIDAGIDPVDVAWRLSDCLPNIISTEFNPNGSERQIQASLEDLADAMRKAVPIAPSMSKEEWLAMRATHNSKTGASKKEHGSSSGEVAAADAKAQPTRVLADVPATVPELPNAYLVRDEDLSQLRAALLTKDGTNSTAITSKTSGGKQKRLQNKVGAHGMVSTEHLKI